MIMDAWIQLDLDAWMHGCMDLAAGGELAAAGGAAGGGGTAAAGN